MNHWEILIIPLIAFGAWILSTIFKTDEPDKSKGPPRRPDGAPRSRVPRRPAPVLDRFLDEAGRRRDMPEGMESHPGPQPNAPPRQPTPSARPTTPRRLAPVLATVIEEPPRPVVRQSVTVEKAPEPLPVPLPPPTLTPLPPAVTPLKRARPVTPVVQEVLRLLRSPKTAGAAFVMREILDRPVALRRPRA